MLIKRRSSVKIVFLMVDENDIKNALSALQPAVQISRNGNAFQDVTNAVEEIGAGWYSVLLTNEETNVSGPLIIRATAPAAHEWRDLHQVYGTLNVTVTAMVGAIYSRVADNVLRRNFANASQSDFGDDKSFRSLLGSVAKDVNRVEVIGTTLSVYEADDSEVLGTQSVVRNGNATPISQLDTD